MKMVRKRVDEEESILLIQDNNLGSSTQQIKAWDVFKQEPERVESGSMAKNEWLDFLLNVAKVLTYIITFVVALGGFILSKITLLFMTSQIFNHDPIPYCNADLDRNREYTVVLPRVERTAWIWVLIFTFLAKELFTLLRSVRMLFFKKFDKPSFKQYFSLTLMESFQAIGSGIFVFAVLPNLDVVKGAMLTNAVCFVPAVLLLLSRNFKKHKCLLIFDVICVTIQASALLLWPLLLNRPILWAIPLALICLSIAWGENFISAKATIGLIRNLVAHSRKAEQQRYRCYIFISMWRCALFFGTALWLVWMTEGDVNFLFQDFRAAFQEHNINISEAKFYISANTNILEDPSNPSVVSSYTTPIWTCVINILASHLAYSFGKFACKVGMQYFSYALPINLATPATITVLVAVCAFYTADECSFTQLIPPYLFLHSPPIYSIEEFLLTQHTWVWILWVLSQAWITSHLWMPISKRLILTEHLFVRPFYDMFLVDQSMGLNRRREDLGATTGRRKDEDSTDGEADEEDGEDVVTRIFACGTMWHETKEEMMEFLKSIMRMDEDQASRRLVRNYLKFDRSYYYYYELETHILFDDAFIRKNQKDNDPLLNDYVKTLVESVNAAAYEVHKVPVVIKSPEVYKTAYGGRLAWTLPGRSKMIAHLKDTRKIQTKKRWSQVMYMYYLLGHRLMDSTEVRQSQKNAVAENTFLLALDGDIDFQPEAVHLLVERMQKSKILGAACGRIHPLGSGPLVWFQKFEYAVGHWLQKATEHMIGCVLCSPGCFSLFRASALMDTNVMRKYTTRPERAIEFVQYDQGEDRWLCTLLLQQGYRVEYCAASDAYTHCPEGFNEFYNQRRRWMPSTTANILDLLLNYKRVTKINNNISKFYIYYQVLLMVGTTLGPGTIFLMLVGALVAVFDLSQWSSFLWNAIPVLFFMAVCFLCKSKVQLFFAGFISALYGLVMMAVLVGVGLQITLDGLLAPSSLFFLCITSEMIITALLHPKEINCLPYGIIYYVTVPSMYLLLVIYSVFNLNNISWGTREVTVEKKDEDEEEEEDDEDDVKVEKTKKSKVLRLLGGEEAEEGTFECSISSLFRCLLFTHKSENNEKQQLIHVSNELREINERLDQLFNTPPIEEAKKPPNTFPNEPIVRSQSLINVDDYVEEESPQSSLECIEPNSWMNYEKLGPYQNLDKEEEIFWNDLIKTYLRPIVARKSKKAKIAQDLKDLRDKASFAFFMLNALFVLIVMLLTLQKDSIHVKWPFGVKVNFTYVEDKNEIYLYKEYLQLEPIGFVCLFFFFAILIIQFVAMLFHRLSTFSQILRNTKIRFRSKANQTLRDADEILYEDPVEIVKAFSKIKGADTDDEEKEVPVERRKTVHNLVAGNKRREVNSTEEAFKLRMERYKRKIEQDKKLNQKDAIKMEAFKAIERRATNANLNVRFNVQYANPAFEDSAV